MQGFIVPDGDRIAAPQANPVGGMPGVRQLIPPAPAKPPAPRDPLAVRKDQLDIRLKEKELAKAEKPNAMQATFREPIDKILTVIDAAANSHRMTRQGGLASNPLGRVIGAKIPGTAPKNLTGYLDTIGANTAFETLQQMRQDSPTGGAVGNVSDSDMRLLRSTIASLDPAQGTEKFQRDLSTVLRSYQKVLYKIPGGKEAFHEWRVNWLGHDPEKKQPAQPKQGGVKFLGFE